MSKTMTNDMTSGNPTKLIINFMIPLFLGNLFQQFYNIADSVVAGKFVGVNALAAIGSTTSLMFLVTGLLNGAGSGFAILISQWFGAKDYKNMRRYLAMSLYLMVIIVVVMTVGLSLANEPLLRLMNSPENLIGDIKSYMGVIYAGLFATGAYNMLAAVLRAVGDSKSPLYFLIISGVINIVLDIVFVICLGTGVVGCGYATVIAQGISAVLCFIYILKKFPILHLKKEDFEFSGELCRRLLALGVPMALQFSITSIGTIIVQAAINVYGATYFYFLWCSNGNLCWTELWSRKDGSSKARRAKHTDYGFDLEFCIDGLGIVVWEIRNLSVCGSNRNRCGRGGTYLFQSSCMVLSFSRQYFYLSKCPAGNGIWACANAWRSV